MVGTSFHHSSAAGELPAVIAGGYCIGCGACAVTPGSSISVRLDPRYRYFKADLGAESISSRTADEICPFAATTNETELGKTLFSGLGEAADSRIGYHLGTYAGYALDGDFRTAGSSGGLTTWLLAELHAKNLIDGVLHVRATSDDPDGLLFRYAISRSEEDIRQGAKSRYYPVEMSQVLGEVLARPGRYALVGVPCFIKAARLLMLQNPVFKERIVYTVAIVCGHLKSASFAEMVAWQVGIVPSELVSIDFRQKIPGQIASDYGIAAVGCGNGKPVHVAAGVHQLFGTNWGYGFFKYSACDYCDDVVGETADVSFGDAWLARYLRDSGGTNIVVVRNPAIAALLHQGVRDRRIHLDPLTPDEIVESQASGFRHRREGLAYRLYLKRRAGQWHPRKRVEPNREHLTRKQRKVFDLRLRLVGASHEAFPAAKEANEFELFRKSLARLVEEYDRLYRPSFLRRAIRAIFRRICALYHAHSKAKKK